VPYPKRLLNEGEDLALDLRPHWWYFWKHILWGVAIFGLLILIFSNVFGHGDVRTWELRGWAIVGLVWAVFLVWQYLKWNYTHFVVTSDRVVFRTGVFGKHGTEIPMERINNINFHQTFWERIIGAGDLEIESAGKDGQSRFEDIWHPDGVQQEIYRQMEASARKHAGWSNPAMTHASPAPEPPPAQPQADIPEQLERLADLRDKGVISAEEFEQKKAQLLERM
jgi:uncharacterized membrane protein YdbT with pleckstrin-like domain